MSVSNFVESVEFIELSVGATDTLVSGSLTKGQNYENCVPFFTSSSSSTYGDSKFFDVYFSGTTSSGFINFERANQRSNTATIMCYVVEFNPEEVRVQQGTFDVTSSYTHTVSLGTTLSGIDKAAMTFGWKSSSTSNTDYSYHTVQGTVSNTSSLTFYKVSVGSSCTGHWFLFEDLNDNFRVTHVNSTLSVAEELKIIDSTRTVDPLRTFLLCSYAVASTTTSQPQRQTCRIRLYTNNSLYISKYTATAVNNYWSAQVFEFLDTSKVYTPFFVERFDFSTNTTEYTSSELPFTVDTDTSSLVASMMQGVSSSEATSTAAFAGVFVASKINGEDSVYLEKSNDGYAISSYTPTVVDWAGIDVDLGSNDSIIPEGKGVGQSFVKSVENFRFELTRTFGARALTKNQNWENCVVFASFFGDNVSSPYYARDVVTQVYLSSPGIVGFRGWTNSFKRYVDVSVVEFWPNQIKVQRGEVTSYDSSTVEDTIEEVSSLDKSFIVSSVLSTVSSSLPGYSFIRSRIKDTTTVEFYRYSTGSHFNNVSYFVVEDLQDNFHAIHSTGTFSSYDIFYDNSTIWGSHNCIIISSYTADSTATYIDRAFTSIKYNNVHSPVYFSKTSATSNIFWASTVVKFLDGRVHTQQIPITFSTSTTTSSGTGTYDSKFLNYSNALSCFNVSTLSTASTNSSAVEGNPSAFASIRILDYDSGTYEYARQYHASYTTETGFVLVNWIGVNYRADNNIPLSTPTKSFIRSIQHNSFYDSESEYQVFLTKGQNVEQCVPFLCSGANQSSAYVAGIYRNVFRFDDEEMFLIRFHSDPTGNRHLSCYILEFNDEIKIQKGSSYSVDTYIEFTIEEVNLNRAFLVFYCGVNSNTSYGATSIIVGRFLNSTTLRFERYSAALAMYVTWYVVECPDDDNYWYVNHYSDVPSSSVSTISVAIDGTDINRTMLLTSYSMDSTVSYASRNLFYTRFTNNDKIVYFQKNSSTSSVPRYNIEVIEMSMDLCNKGFRSVPGFISITTSSGVASLGLREPYHLDLDRSIVINSSSGNECYSVGTSAGTWDEGYLYYYFVDGNTIGATKSDAMTVETIGSFFAYQWPEYNKYYIEGNVTELESPVSRTVNAYRSSTGELVDSTTSVSGTGYFLLETPYPDEHYVVCLDDLAGISYNHLVYGKIIPTVISGSFAYNNGLVTLSGLEVGVPLCYQ